jgi:hypothetical protein
MLLAVWNMALLSYFEGFCLIAVTWKVGNTDWKNLCNKISYAVSQEQPNFSVNMERPELVVKTIYNNEERFHVENI